MGLHLIAEFSWTSFGTWWAIIQVALGLGLVIFVHELGHFAVAKMCGVKCDKFYLGFDIFGLKLAKFQWGETEYGIGILPLGGYVKMLGQDDNPNNTAKELERSRVGPGTPAGPPTLDPRSYLAKPVWQRMAIISAGVIMNVLSAVLMAAIAYSGGVREIPCVVGRVFAGKAAWRAGMQPGDRIVRLGTVDNPRFRDLQSGVMLGDDIDQGVPFVIRRPGVSQDISVKIVPDRIRKLPMIGIANSYELILADPPISKLVFGPQGKSGLLPGDVVTHVGEVPVSTWPDAMRELALHPEPITLTIQRTPSDTATAEGQSTPATATAHAIDLPARAMWTVGLVMELGEITAVQAGSPADLAGVQAGDRIQAVDGQTELDPLRWPDQLRGQERVQLTLLRGTETVEIDLTARTLTTLEQPGLENDPMTAPTLGIAYAVNNRVAAVVAGSPAADQGLKAGDTLLAVRVVPPSDAVRDEYKFPQEEVELDLGDEDRNWPLVMFQLQDLLPGTTLEVELAGERKVTLQPVLASDWWNADRGLFFEPLTDLTTAHSVGEALRLGIQETREGLSQVFRFLRKIGGQVPATGVAGPVSIAKIAYNKASQGWTELLLFLVMLSCNLAIMNFLPIPLLDGGHMVLLTLEWIRGKPVSERIVGPILYLALALLLSLMVFVFLLDIEIIPRDL